MPEIETVAKFAMPKKPGNNSQVTHLTVGVSRRIIIVRPGTALCPGFCYWVAVSAARLVGVVSSALHPGLLSCSMDLIPA